MLILTSYCDLSAQTSSLSPGVQAVMLSKIFNYVKSIPEIGKQIVLVVHDRNSTKYKEVVEAFTNEKIKTATILTEEVPNVISNFRILYFAEGTRPVQLKNILISNKILIISADPTLVSGGEAAISVGAENNKTTIYLNTKVLNETSHEVSPALINISKLFK